MAIQNFYGLGLLGAYLGSRAKKKALQNARRGLWQGRNTLGSDIAKDETISDRTKEELSQGLSSNRILNWAIGGGGTKHGVKTAAGILGGFGDTFSKAREGVDPKFKTRQVTQQLFNTMVDTPDSQRLRGGILNFGSSVRK